MKASIIGSVFFAISALASPFAHGPDDDGDGPDHKPDTTLKTASQTATAAGLTSLVEALKKAGLVATVDGLKDVTIFAPTNEAFTKVASTTAGLSKEALGAILKYHVVQKVVKSTDLKDKASVPTLNGAPITVSLIGKAAKINTANVVKADVAFKGGVVHVIDAVLIPPSSKKC
ncbi:TGF beta induced protein ig-h3 precursor [Venturia nashicola]|uniref:TGF beta induced protein ig-h3 n=1 Tax=Venturia nashicola TaxID=86259 RepID=A0A4Z1NZY3_9PEZI|nr:TGF beta induced protein ig-h3 precursor [Venturia nashicola]TLD20177.1 TGF beta induced protein ig-h3 precursor [Venturia nashicola]